VTLLGNLSNWLLQPTRLVDSTSHPASKNSSRHHKTYRTQEERRVNDA
jgi:hypothetical protein